MKTLDIKYIYSPKGEEEAVIIPIALWEKLKKYLGVTVSRTRSKKSKELSSYRGILRHLHLNIEEESAQLRNQWERI